MGGAEVQTLSLMDGLRARGHDVAFLGSCPTLLVEATNHKPQVTSCILGPPPVTPWLAFSFLWRQFAMRQRLIAAMDAVPLIPDTILMLSLSEKLLLTDWAVRRGIRVLWIEHDRVGRWLTANPWLPRLRRLARSALTVTVSELSKTHYARLGFPAERTIAIPDGIDAGRIGTPRTTWSSDALHIGCVARLTRDKGVDVLVDAVGSMPAVHLSIVGSGRDAQEIQAQIAGSSAAHRIHLEERTAHIGDFYRRMDALVLPARDHDPFGMVAAEAMLTATPVIVTDACGIAGYLTDGTDALIVPAGNSGALQQALQRLHDPAERERIGCAGRQTALEQFGIDAMIDAYDQVISGA